MTNLWQDHELRLVDVGAGGGLDKRWASLTPAFRAILFEPDSAAFARLQTRQSAQETILNTAVSDQRQTLTFYQCREPELSSVYPPNLPFLQQFPQTDAFTVTGTRPLAADTLDNQLAAHHLPADIDFIKLDVQGHELAVLQGAGNCLPHLIGVEVEVAFAPIYQDQPLFTEVHTFLTGHGLALFDLKRYFWRRQDRHTDSQEKGQLMLADALYFRTPDQVLAWPELTAAKCRRAALVYLAYGYGDLALALCRDTAVTCPLSPADRSSIMRQAGKQKRRVLPDFPGKEIARAACLRLAALLHPRTYYTFDRKIGCR